MSSEVPVSQCPKCGYLTDRAGSVDDDTKVPTPGDLSICLRCAHVTKYADDLTLVELGSAELIALSLDQDFVDFHSRIQIAGKYIWRVDDTLSDLEGDKPL